MNINNLKSLHFWLKFMGIIYAISTGFQVLAILFCLVISFPLAILYILNACILGLFAFLLLKAASYFKDACNEEISEENINEGLNFLRKYFKISGILMMVSIVIVLITLSLGFLVSGAMI